MDPTTAGLVGLAALFLLLILRTPVAIALMLVGFVGVAALNSTQAALSTLSGESFVMASFYELSVIPLFVLMGNFATACGMSRDLYAAAYSWVGRMRGGLASATIVGCAGFAALSGSSVASAVTMGRVALPEMDRYGYSPKLATGAVAAGGTLGILIPPSTGFVIYAVLTEASIGKLFLAGVFPGILLTLLFVATIWLRTTINPALGPKKPAEDGPVQPYWQTWRPVAMAVIAGLAIASYLGGLIGPWTMVAVAGFLLMLSAIASRDQATSLARAAPIVGLILLTIGGIYGGIFTPVEAAAVGAVLAMFIALVRRSMNRATWSDVLLQTMKTTGMSFLILIGAHIFQPFLALTHLPGDLAIGLTSLDIGPLGILLLVMAVFIVLGTFLEGFAMLVLMVPIVLPLIEKAGVGAYLGITDVEQLRIWFGVLMVIVLEMGLISPPVGVNVFVVKGIADDVSMGDIFRGIVPFWLAMVVCLGLLIAFPDIALFLPNTMIK